eukprot:Rhum_TRINITY_DN22766_c0_g1::Rhum_TRINITY_DN22766_c0_g1_i1::g.176054::m.176054
MLRTVVALAAAAAVAAQVDTCGTQTGTTTTAVTCPVNTVNRADYATIECDKDTSADQCVKLCCLGDRCGVQTGTKTTIVTCPAGDVKRTDFDTIECDKDNSDDDCRFACCQYSGDTCDTQTGGITTPVECPVGKVRRGGRLTNVPCDKEASATQCETECCETSHDTCSLQTGASKTEPVVCPPGQVKKRLFSTIRCDRETETATDCKVACCEDSQDTCEVQTGPKSAAVQCPAGTVKRGAFNTIKCDREKKNCVPECCQQSCSTTSFTCKPGFSKKLFAAFTACAGALCTEDECCDLVPQTPLGVRTTLPHTRAFCAVHEDCQTLNQDSDFKNRRCFSGVCSCGAIASGDLCQNFANPSIKAVSLQFNKTDSANRCNPAGHGALSTTIVQGLIKAIEEHSDGRVLNIVAYCKAGATAEENVATATVIVREPVAGRWQFTQLDQFNEWLTIVAPAIRPALGGGLVKAQVAAACGAPNNINEAHESIFNECLITKCDSGYRKPDANRLTTTNCVARVNNERFACVADYDCTWDAALPTCTNGVCVKTFVPEKKPVKIQTPLQKHFCHTDAQCRTHGDLSAVCDKNNGLGNWCQCSPGFAYPTRFIPLCMDAGRGEAPIPLVFRTRFEDQTTLQCPPTQAAVDAVKRLHEIAFDSKITGFTYFCHNGGTVFMGKANVKFTLARDAAESFSGNFLVERLIALLANGGSLLPAERATPVPRTDAPVILPTPTVTLVVGAPSRDASALQGAVTLTVHDPLSALNGAEPTEAQLGFPNQCPLAFTKATILDEAGNCQSLECESTHELKTIDGVQKCLKRGDTNPVDNHVRRYVDSDDDLSTADKAAIGLGIAAGALLIIGIAISCVKCRLYRPKSAEPEPEVMEPVAEVEVREKKLEPEDEVAEAKKEEA